MSFFIKLLNSALLNQDIFILGIFYVSLGLCRWPSHFHSVNQCIDDCLNVLYSFSYICNEIYRFETEYYYLYFFIWTNFSFILVLGNNLHLFNGNHLFKFPSEKQKSVIWVCATTTERYNTEPKIRGSLLFDRTQQWWMKLSSVMVLASVWRIWQSYQNSKAIEHLIDKNVNFWLIAYFSDWLLRTFIHANQTTCHSIQSLCYAKQKNMNDRKGSTRMRWHRINNSERSLEF